MIYTGFSISTELSYNIGMKDNKRLVAIASGDLIALYNACIDLAGAEKNAEHTVKIPASVGDIDESIYPLYNEFVEHMVKAKELAGKMLNTIQGV